MQEENEDFNEIYKLAVYAVFDDGREVKFQIGEVNAGIDRILGTFNAGSYALITAFNPLSRELPVEENLQRQEALRAVLSERGFQFLEGYGGSEDGSWLPEPSYFVLGISEPGAVELARMFEQRAIVFGEKGSAPRLVWCQQVI